MAHWHGTARLMLHPRSQCLQLALSVQRGLRTTHFCGKLANTSLCVSVLRLTAQWTGSACCKPGGKSFIRSYDLRRNLLVCFVGNTVGCSSLAKMHAMCPLSSQPSVRQHRARTFAATRLLRPARPSRLGQTLDWESAAAKVSRSGLLAVRICRVGMCQLHHN